MGSLQADDRIPITPSSSNVSLLLFKTQEEQWGLLRSRDLLTIHMSKYSS